MVRAVTSCGRIRRRSDAILATLVDRGAAEDPRLHGAAGVSRVC